MNRFAVVLLLAAGCARPAPRFADRAVLWRDPDARPIPMPPVRPDPGTGRLWPGTRDGVFLPAQHAFTVDYGVEAVNVNALDEVPDSSWYEDPKRDPADPAGPPLALPAARMERGAVTDPEPPRPPFYIIQQKEGGSAAGFVVDDALGRRYVLKLDPAGHTGLVTGSDVVASRLAWAAGWRVPADQIVDLSPRDLTLSPTASQIDRWGRAHRLDPGDVDTVLRDAGRAPDGRIRAVASRYLPGTILGSFRWFGKEPHDANDRYPHEDRRDLRGFGVWAAWVDDVDTMENNTLDSYLGAPGHGHVVHYQQDVGGSFGNFASKPAKYWMGYETYFLPGGILASLLTIGVIPHGWESARWQRRRQELLTRYPELGGYSGENFDPRAWKPILDNPAFVRQTRRDRYWGAKRVVSFSRDELRGAVAAGHYRPAAADYLLSALWQRRERIARDAFLETAALDYFAVDGARLCFSDLWVTSGLGGGAATTYRAREDGAVIAERHGDAGGRLCVTLPRRAGYRVIELAALRPGERKFGPRVDVHLAARAVGPNAARVIGVIH